MLWLVATTVLTADAGMLMDAATGLHIRTGQYILEQASAPHVDPFSFTKPGHAGLHGNGYVIFCSRECSRTSASEASSYFVPL
jgi:hypothetical protein